MQYPPEPAYQIGPLSIHPDTVASFGYVAAVAIGMFWGTYGVIVGNIPLQHPVSMALYVSLSGAIMTGAAFWAWRSRENAG